ncbi:PAS domain S-box protein [Balneola sp. MJW-20]|uniref:PAS domain S-box protein n=1 Tax=Gracilimonas aurantiaca TaxID=3234185 RepID=UPI0034666415
MKLTKGSSFFDLQPMFVCDQSSLKILDANDAALKILGFKRKELYNKGINDIGKRVNLGDIAPELKVRFNNTTEKLWVIKDSGQRDLFFQLSAHLFNYKGKPAKLVVAHDVNGVFENKPVLSTQLHIDNFPLAEIEWDTDLRIIRWSEQAENLFGYSEQEAVNAHRLLEKFIHPHDLEKVQQQMKKTLELGEEQISIVNRNIRKDGEIIYCEWYNSFLYDEKGEVVSIYSLTHDVTDREKAMRNSQRSMKSYEDLFNSISDAIYLLDNKGKIIEANQGLKLTYGYDRSEVIGSHMRVLSAPGKYDEKKFEEVKARAHARPVKYKGWGKKKNGEVFPTDVLVNIGNYFGNEAYIIIERDVSERMESDAALKHREGLFSRLFNSSPIGIALLNEHKEVEMINHGFEKIFGYTEEELKGLELDKVIVPEQDWDDALQLSEAIQVTEVTSRRKRKDGTVVDVIIYAIPVIVEGKTVGIYGLYVDITDRIEAEKQVRKSLREKEVLLAEIHHRVKNNLAVITGLLELQSYNTNDENAQSILRDSQMRVNSIALVHEKLYQNEDLSQVSIAQYLKDLTHVVFRSMSDHSKDVDIDLDLDDINLPITQAIPCGLLVNEILTNSFKHAFIGREEGTIEIHFKDRDQDKLELIISDDGVGLPSNGKTDMKASLGMNLIKTLSNQLKADYEILNDNGARFIFVFKKEQ